MSHQIDTRIIETTTQHRGDRNALWDFLEKLKGPGRVIIHVAPGGQIRGFDEVQIKREPLTVKENG